MTTHPTEKMDYVILRADGSEQRGTEARFPTGPHKAVIAAIQRLCLAAIGPDADMEHVNVYPPSEPWRGEDAYRDMFVDDLGREKGLPVNAKATALYHNNLKQHEPGYLPDDTCIYGDVLVLLSRKVWK